ncbi:MAG: hypothetical protein ACXVB9_08905 [Bdellovibrionota bacterium]
MFILLGLVSVSSISFAAAGSFTQQGKSTASYAEAEKDSQYWASRACNSGVAVRASAWHLFKATEEVSDPGCHPTIDDPNNCFEPPALYYFAEAQYRCT